MKPILFAFLLLTANLAYSQVNTHMELINLDFDAKSKIWQEMPFNFYESCERMPATIIGNDPITKRERPITVSILRPREGARNQRVLIVPPTGGVNQLDRDYAKQLCDHGIEAWVIVEWDRGVRDHQYRMALNSHDIIARRALAAVRHIVNHMKSPVGILGTSSGAIVASVALAIEPKLEVGLLIAGGAGMTDILLNSRQELIARLRRQRLKEFGWTRDQYKEQLEQNVILDLRHFSEGLVNKKIATVVATRDVFVSYESQLELEKLCNATRLGTIDDDHVGTILRTFLLSSHRVVRYFKETL